MAAKTIVCRCEDVTLADVEHAVALGYGHIEEVKRYTGFGTGTCGGKECMALCAMLLAEKSGLPPSEMEPFTSRPPIATIQLGTLANGERTDAGAEGEHD